MVFRVMTFSCTQIKMRVYVPFCNREFLPYIDCFGPVNATCYVHQHISQKKLHMESLYKSYILPINAFFLLDAFLKISTIFKFRSPLAGYNDC